MSEILDAPKKYYSIETHKIILSVEKRATAPIFFAFVCSMLLLVAAAVVIVSVIVSQSVITSGTVISTLMLGSGGFYLLRYALWNIFGKEVFEFSPQEVTHYADLKYFQVRRKNYKREDWIRFSSEFTGDNRATLSIHSDNWTIEGATKIPKEEMETLLEEVKHFAHD